MATTIRPELSEKNPYWIEKHRYYELKHFCLQYPIWQKQYSLISNTRSNEAYSLTPIANQSFYDSTGETAVDRTYYSLRIELLEKVAKETDDVIGNYILKGVTEGWSYDILKARLNIPCCKDIYYELYRRFFWLLDKERG
jgi:hypothetical protein|nr:MAG TPA: hypothetical protein [Caudoviricetes sp.]